MSELESEGKAGRRQLCFELKEKVTLSMRGA